MPGTVNPVQADGAQMVFWFPDPVAALGRQLMVLAPYGAVFFKDHISSSTCGPTSTCRSTICPSMQSAVNGRSRLPGTEPYLVVVGTMYPVRVPLLDHARLFEAAGCGTAVLTEFRPIVPALFAICDEVLVQRIVSP